jgi:predicted nucleotide-binding protein (sugar kinase/HSP70/actin superfamily)
MVISPNSRTSSDSLNVSQGKLACPLVANEAESLRAVGPDEDDPVFANAANVLSDTEAREDMQTFVFSATLSKDLQNNLKHKKRASKKGGKKASALGKSFLRCIS